MATAHAKAPKKGTLKETIQARVIAISQDLNRSIAMAKLRHAEDTQRVQERGQEELDQITNIKAMEICTALRDDKSEIGDQMRTIFRAMSASASSLPIDNPTLSDGVAPLQVAKLLEPIVNRMTCDNPRRPAEYRLTDIGRKVADMLVALAAARR